MADQDAFPHQADRYRPELLAYCYRMLGSVHDAEDLVQETYLRAWRSYRDFEGRATIRTWLYRIATNVCLRALEHRARRPLPSGIGGPTDDPTRPLGQPGPEIPWLQPLPDALTAGHHADPATIVAARAGTRLALVAALQHLPPRQRAILILREVLNMPTTEIVELLDSTPAAVNSALQRARERLTRHAPTDTGLAEPDDPEQRALLDRYAQAFESTDIPALVRLLAEDAVWEMPPIPEWFTGRAVIGELLALKCPPAPDGSRMVATRANGQPAFGLYVRRPDGGHHAYAVHVLTLDGRRITRVVAFADPRLFPVFALPPVHPG
jgi:RNA polymerase sigma-70 factor, ECF subfamily